MPHRHRTTAPLPELLRPNRTPRRERVAEQLREEISQLMLREMKDPRVRLASISEVRVSPDLRDARVMVSAVGVPHGAGDGGVVGDENTPHPTSASAPSKPKRRSRLTPFLQFSGSPRSGRS